MRAYVPSLALSAVAVVLTTAYFSDALPFEDTVVWLLFVSLLLIARGVEDAAS